MLGWLFGQTRKNARNKRIVKKKRNNRPEKPRTRAATVRNLHGDVASQVLSRLGKANAARWALAYKGDNPARHDARALEFLSTVHALHEMARKPYAREHARVGGKHVVVTWGNPFAPKNTFVYETTGSNRGLRKPQEVVLLEKMMLPYKAISEEQLSKLVRTQTFHKRG